MAHGLLCECGSGYANPSMASMPGEEEEGEEEEKEQQEGEEEQGAAQWSNEIESRVEQLTAILHR